MLNRGTMVRLHKLSYMNNIVRIPWMPFSLSSLSKQEDEGLVSRSMHRRKKSCMSLFWMVGNIFLGSYLVSVYVLPLIGLINQPLVPLKSYVEMVICFIPVFSGLSLSLRKIRLQNPVISNVNGIFFVSLGDYAIGVCCLDIISVSGSVYLDENGKPRYIDSMLLAMRAGMSKSVTMAFEAGVTNKEPFLHIFITAAGS
ncbi:MAG: hypothetical protein ACFFDQ_00130, partial [Candidatus Thorarchaeota archaeon]